MCVCAEGGEEDIEIIAFLISEMSRKVFVGGNFKCGATLATVNSQVALLNEAKDLPDNVGESADERIHDGRGPPHSHARAYTWIYTEWESLLWRCNPAEILIAPTAIHIGSAKAALRAGVAHIAVQDIHTAKVRARAAPIRAENLRLDRCAWS